MNDFLAQLRERLPFILAVAVTTLWVVGAAMFIKSTGGLAALQTLAPADLAILVAAFGGPLAALWMVLAVFEQRRALTLFGRRVAEMTKQNRQSLQQAESQTRTLLQLQNQASRAQAMETRKLALHDMASSASVLAERLGAMTRDAANVAWTRYGAGDVNVFVQAFLSFAVSHPDIAERMAQAVVRDQVAGAALATFVRRYERLTSAESEDKMAAEIFDDGALGRAYRLFKSADELATKLQQPPSPPASPAAPKSATAQPAPDGDLFDQADGSAGDSGHAQRRLKGLSDRLEAAAPSV